jgi:RHH-type proline utilization regulon transcriptional repressor/proline dehydrogenase/delta 1-pyrroline-5-carboxylate dehydrogenase
MTAQLSREKIRAAYLADEAQCVSALLTEAALDESRAERVRTHARELVSEIRSRKRRGLDAFLHEYALASEEGVVLMCLAEALLRIPDDATADRLIRSLISRGEWGSHLRSGASPLVNASTFGLMLTGRLVRALSHTEAAALVRRLAARLGEATVRVALKAAMGILASEFVLGETIEQALERASRDYRYSFDMLGEAAMTGADAERYYEAYIHAIRVVGKERARAEDPFSAPGVSVKLSALHPRYEYAKRERVLRELGPRVLELAREARLGNVIMTLDAEEADRLEPSLDVFEQVYGSPALERWEGFGLAVQAYQKRAPHVIDWLAQLAQSRGRMIPIRLVKGAYWDSEVKRAQVAGLSGFPVFTRKAHTDVSYLACGRRILAHKNRFYPAFATHNAHTVAYFLELSKASGVDFEFQRLHGMGEALYAEVMAREGVPCRVYAPVGSFDTLLAYLVRRLLENGANTSFVNRIGDLKLPVEKVAADPVRLLAGREAKPHPRIRFPRELYSPERVNSRGINLADPDSLSSLLQAMQSALNREWRAAPLVAGQRLPGEARPVLDPADRKREVGQVVLAGEEALEAALDLASKAAASWDSRRAEERAECLEHAANRLEEAFPELAALVIREGGRTIPDAVSEVREAVDYCRYYAYHARRLFGEGLQLPGPSGEDNRLKLHGRGVFGCVSPWNFPLAIFLGQVSAALAAGNAVIAKPAQQTSLVAMRAVELLHEAGIPVDALHLLPAPGGTIGARLMADARIAGVVLTGSSETARTINRALAARAGPIIPFIAETGGQNAMIVDSSALPEQVVADAIASAFNSAGQRCSALRLLFVQEDIAAELIEMLAGAMAELEVGDPMRIATDVGPVIDEEAKAKLESYAGELEQHARCIAVALLGLDTGQGCFFAPRAYEITMKQIPEHEIFGPILHVVRWPADQLDTVIGAINATGYGLTLGVHSRIDETVERVTARAHVGNLYVNRNMIGAVVGVQPFGGEGLSGTGPKAGGPHYLTRFGVERTVSTNTAAAGGNAALLAMDDED